MLPQLQPQDACLPLRARNQAQVEARLSLQQQAPVEVRLLLPLVAGSAQAQLGLP